MYESVGRFQKWWDNLMGISPQEEEVEESLSIESVKEDNKNANHLLTEMENLFERIK